MDIGLVIDTSESLRANGDQWPLVRSFLKQFISQLDIGIDKVKYFTNHVLKTSTATMHFKILMLKYNK